MKTIISLCTGAAILLLAFFISCQKEPTGQQDNVTTTLAENASSNGQPLAAEALAAIPGKKVWLPEASAVKEESDSLIITPPPGFAYLGIVPGGGIINQRSDVRLSITCTCSGKGGCHPFQAKGPWGKTAGCTGDCSNCSMVQKIGGGPMPILIQSGGLYEPGATTRLLKSGEAQPAVFDALYQTDAFQKKLNDLYKEAYEGAPIQKPVANEDGSIGAPEGYSLVAASVMGRSLMVVLPVKYVAARIGMYAAASASCSCSGKNGGGCTLHEKTILGMGSTWCEGSCNGCTLTTGLAPNLSIYDNPRLPVYSVSLLSLAY